MESECSQGCGEWCSYFGFAFNNEKFSDRTIQVKIISELIGPTDANWVRKQKRCRLNSSTDSSVPSDHEDAESNENPSSTDRSSIKTKTIHISTVILAAKSPFFHKLFSNGMAESNQKQVTLQIHESEEAAFMDMLKFMYTNTLSESTPSALLDVLMAADKYEVAACMKYCCRSLQKLPMSRESALLYLDLPSTILMADTIQSLKDDAKKFLVERYKNFNKLHKVMLWLPLVAIEAVLSSDDVQVDSEDEIYDFVMRWAKRNIIEKTSEQREMLIKRLLNLVRFPFLSRSKLEEVLTCTLISLENRSKLVFEAISLETPYRQLPPVKEPERAYNLRPVKVIRFDSPHEKCVVYLDLKYEECARLLPSGTIFSQSFELAGHVFYLEATRHVDEQSLFHSFGFFLCKKDNGSLGVEFEFSSIIKPSEEFVGMHDMVHIFAEWDGFGSPNLFSEPWERFIADDSPYFINGVLHLKAVFKILK